MGVSSRSLGQASAVGGRMTRVYQDLRLKILRNVLAPGTPLSEASLATEHKVSRTPVREALRRLEFEGLVENIPGRGVFVSRMSFEDVNELFELREIVESGALELAAGRISSTQLQSIEQQVQELRKRADASYEEFYRVDSSLHELILQTVNNKTLRRLMDDIMNQVMRVCYLAMSVPGVTEELLQQHLEIIDKLKQGDHEGAKAAMRRHLESVKRAILRRR